MTDCALRLSEEELDRYPLQAEAAADEEADDRGPAGIVPGARVADVDCTPGGVRAALAAAAGPSGRTVGVDLDPEAASRDAPVAGVADAGDLARWQAPMERTDRLDSRPWALIPMFVAVGRVPG